jgi:hypothetical protein
MTDTTKLEEPATGGSYTRCPETGALTRDELVAELALDAAGDAPQPAAEAATAAGSTQE